MLSKDYIETNTATYLKSTKTERCCVCGCEANLIEICSESYFCGDECTSEFYAEYDRWVQRIMRLEENYNGTV